MSPVLMPGVRLLLRLHQARSRMSRRKRVLLVILTGLVCYAFIGAAVLLSHRIGPRRVYLGFLMTMATQAASSSRKRAKAALRSARIPASMALSASGRA